MNAAQSLPRIVRFHGTSHSGPGEAVCPHCGARGSVVHSFEVEDGRLMGAMSGCVKLFPVSPIAREHMRIQKKLDDQRKRGLRVGLNRWDGAALKAIEDFYAGTLTEQDAVRRIESERKSAAAWRRGRFGR